MIIIVRCYQQKSLSNDLPKINRVLLKAREKTKDAANEAGDKW